MKVKWVILGLAAFVLVGAWSALVIAKLFFDPSMAQWVGVVTVAAFATEGFLWVAAGVFGWSFLSKRRAMLGRWRDRLFGRRRTETQTSGD
jgi:hypothetical protein